MRMPIQKAFLVCILIFCFLGCRGVVHRQPPVEPQSGSEMTPTAAETDDVENLDPDAFADANGYFLYLESQFQRKTGNPEKAIFFLELAAQRDPASLFLKKELVVLYLQQEKNETALAVMEAVLAEEPDNVDAMIMVATIKKSLKMEAEAAALYETVLTLDPGRKNIYHLLGKMYLDAGELDDAFRIFTDMSERFEDDYLSYYYLGRIYQTKDDLPRAEAFFLKTLEKAPQLIEPRLELLRIYENSGQERKLIRVYEEILALYPDNIPAALELGLLYHKVEETESARALFEGLGQQSKNDPNVIRTILQNLILQQREKEAIVVLTPMLAVAPENTEIRYLSGVAHENIDELGAALAYFETIETDTRYFPNAAIHMAIIHYKQNDMEKSITILENAMEALSEEAGIELIPYLASFYKEKEMTDEAFSLVSAGLEIEPEHPGLLYEKGVVYDMKGDKDMAMEQMRRVLAIDPDHADALNYIGYTYAEQGINLTEAEQLIIRALETKPNNGYIIDSLGWVYFQKGRFEEALVYLKRAAELVPEDPIILEHLGDVYLKLGQPEKALEFFERALGNKKKDPDEIHNKIDMLRQKGF
jgi:tetratricopeptide (TPR) repeat protein